MFFKKKLTIPSFQENPVDFLLWQADKDIESCRTAIPDNYEKNNFEYVVWNSSSALENLLAKHALQLRNKRDVELAQAALSGAKIFLDYIEDAIAKCNTLGLTERNFIHVGNLTNAFLATFLANDWSRAERLANAAHLPVVQEEGTEGESGGVHDEIPKMLAALILDNQNDFRNIQARYTKDKISDRFFDVYFNYDRLMKFILERDSQGFNHALAQQEILFMQRATDKKVDHGQTLDGFLDNNSRVFDVWATALANVAKHRGMQITYFSDVIPIR
jgi:hypothetical protein